MPQMHLQMRHFLFLFSTSVLRGGDSREAAEGFGKIIGGIEGKCGGDLCDGHVALSEQSLCFL